MRPWVNIARFATILVVVLVAGCALQTGASKTSQSSASSWHGRLAVRVASDPASSPSQSFTAGFDLSGNAQAGELTLFTPLGSTAAALSWSPQSALMRSQSEIRYFKSLDALIESALGTEVPVEALFAWLAGESVTMAGWSADLSQYAKGRITARRLQPAPMAELTLVLEE